MWHRVLVVAILALLISSDPHPATGDEGGGGSAAARAGLSGLCYGPYRDGESPEVGLSPLVEGMREDLVLLGKLTGAVRTYGSGQTPGRIPGLCEELGLDCWPGAWISTHEETNRAEVEALVEACNAAPKHVKAAVVGNEVLLRGDLGPADLLSLIRGVKERVEVPVTTAEVWSVWLENPDLARECDLLLAHVHPYWDGVPIEGASDHVVRIWKKLRTAFPGKRVVIGETGWPAGGEPKGRAVPGAENQARFVREFRKAAAEEGIEYFLFEAFSESWKRGAEGSVGPHWGIYRADGSIRPEVAPLVPEAAAKGIDRPPRKLEWLSVTLPLPVYRDFDAGALFHATGWMGRTGDIELLDACTENPHSGRTCIRIDYHPGGARSWSGVYWQHPGHNWGERPGVRIDGPARLTFWARGRKGGETAEFKVGGIRDRDLPYRDSCRPVSTGVVRLTSEWRRLTIDIREEEIELLGGFCWVSNGLENPDGATIYLDDIVLEAWD